jgi:hypothetical protein
MRFLRRLPIAAHVSIVLVAALLVAAGCGSSNGSSSKSSSPSTGALSAEAQSAATGDIPDNQVFLRFSNAAAHYSIKYPEGWTQRGSGGDVTFQDKNNIVHIVVTRGAAPTPASVRAGLKSLQGSTPTLRFHDPKPVQVGKSKAVKATYTTRSEPNPVTGKRVTLTVDRYEFGAGGRHAIVDLGTPKGVDNVDAYRLMSESFAWR